MRIKRIWSAPDKKTGERRVEYLVHETGAPMGGPRHFSPGFVEGGGMEGWLTLADGKIALRTAPDEADLVFEIVAPPGVFCCHCGEKLEAGNEIAQAHVAEHGDAASPDPQNPAGYRVDSFYRCVRVQ